MMNDGGPAFPVPEKPYSQIGFETGMTLRDYFAGQALAGIMSDPDTAYAEAVELAYNTADTMLRHRAGEFTRGARVYMDPKTTGPIYVAQTAEECAWALAKTGMEVPDHSALIAACNGVKLVAAQFAMEAPE